jgi:hypothetical protein
MSPTRPLGHRTADTLGVVSTPVYSVYSTLKSKVSRVRQ